MPLSQLHKKQLKEFEKTKQEKAFEKKLIPLKEKEYVVTDQCMWEMEVADDYNPYDDKRKPHVMQCVDPVSGTIVNLKSGSIIKVIKAIN